MTTPLPVVSIVVPTRDRPASLAACLESLDRQDGAPPFEVVVVDDGSADAAAVAATVAAHPRARLVAGGGRGPAAARNTGARAAQGTILCFTDDDCRPVPGWAQALADSLRGGAEVAAGPTMPITGASRCTIASQAITNHVVAESAGDGGTVGFAPTSNLACRAGVHGAHPFDESFPLAAGEDREWCARLAGHGMRIAWVPAAVVSHDQRLTPATFVRQQLRYGRGAYRFLRAGEGGQVQGPGFYVRLLRMGWRAGPTVGALILAAQAITAAGLTAEAGAAARSAFQQRLSHHR